MDTLPKTARCTRLSADPRVIDCAMTETDTLYPVSSSSKEKKARLVPMASFVSVDSGTADPNFFFKCKKIEMDCSSVGGSCYLSLFLCDDKINTNSNIIY